MDKVYTFDKGTNEYSILKYAVSRKARQKLGIKFPIFGKHRNKAVVPSEVYLLVMKFFMTIQVNPELYLSDIVEIQKES